MLHDGQAETRSTRRSRPAGINPEEAFGHSRDELFRDADARIACLEASATRHPFPQYMNGPGLGRESDRIIDQVEEYRVQLRFFAEQGGVLIQVEVEREAWGRLRHFLADGLEHARDVDEVVASLSFHRLEAGKLQQIANDPRHAIDLSLHLFDRPIPGRGDRRVLEHCLEIAAEHGQRRAQLVRRIRHEVATRALEAILVRDIAKYRQSLPSTVWNVTEKI